jgi:hypothetical protein
MRRSRKTKLIIRTTRRGLKAAIAGRGRFGRRCVKVVISEITRPKQNLVEIASKIGVTTMKIRMRTEPPSAPGVDSIDHLSISKILGC